MVKRAIAVLAGAAAGVALWYLAAWARDAMKPEPIMSFGDCARYGYDCVSYRPDEPATPVPAPVSPAADPCKTWLTGAESGGAALLSQCLHTARRERDGERLEQAKWARRTGVSS